MNTPHAHTLGLAIIAQVRALTHRAEVAEAENAALRAQLDCHCVRCDAFPGECRPQGGAS